MEFQLASDVLRTAISPTFEDLAKLAAVAAIRTALNYFLAREMREEQSSLRERLEAAHDSQEGARATARVTEDASP